MTAGRNDFYYCYYFDGGTLMKRNSRFRDAMMSQWRSHSMLDDVTKKMTVVVDVGIEGSDVLVVDA